MKHNWTTPVNFDICFCEIFDRYHQSFCFWKENWHSVSIYFWGFHNISQFHKMIRLHSPGSSWGNSYTMFFNRYQVLLYFWWIKPLSLVMIYSQSMRTVSLFSMHPSFVRKGSFIVFKIAHYRNSFVGYCKKILRYWFLFEGDTFISLFSLFSFFKVPIS